MGTSPIADDDRVDDAVPAPLVDASAQSLDVRERLQAEWARCAAGDIASQARWRRDDDGASASDTGVSWTATDGLTLAGGETRWRRVVWDACGPEVLARLGHCAIEVTIRGVSSAAGFGVGKQREFVTTLASPDAAHHLRLEVHASSGAWAFRVNGALMARSARDAAVASAADILGGQLALTVRTPGRVTFSDFTVRPLDARCRLSVVMTCHRFQQRLRASLRHWCHQTLPAGALEVIVVNPASPDGTHELLDSVRRTWPHAGVRELAVGADIARNKGAMINQAVRASRGDWIWLTDADCLFPPDCVSGVLTHVEARPACLFYGQRRYLSRTQTDAVLNGAIDPIAEFARLSATAVARPPDDVAWGYTQIVHRSVLDRVPYRELAETFAKTDTLFVLECQQRQIHPARVPGLVCLHLDHPFAWGGTDTFM